VPTTPTAITIGNFDGVHRGHVALVQRCRARAAALGPAVRTLALCFDPHPATILAPAAAPSRLTSFEERSRLLLAAGADEVVRLTPARELLALSPQDFVAWLIKTHSPVVVVEGEDFHFGKGRAGTIDTLRDLGCAHGFEVDVVGPVEVVLTDHLIARASSTLARWLLTNGRVRDAGIVLGRPFALEGTVTKGDQRGRTIGFPTANLATDCLPPADGVYACLATLPNGSTCPAAVNIGERPTFAGTERRIEVHLLAPTPPALDSYGWTLRIEFIAWLRDQIRFASIDDLKGQLARDTARASTITLD
jgi:riboflavin kinase/FMN adenylyltransferase